MDLPSTTSTRAAPANGATATAARRSTTRNTQARAIATLLLLLLPSLPWRLGGGAVVASCVALLCVAIAMTGAGRGADCLYTKTVWLFLGEDVSL